MYTHTPELVVFDADGTLVPDRPDELTGRAFWHFVEHGIFTPDDTTLAQLALLRQADNDPAHYGEHRAYIKMMNSIFDHEIKAKSRKEVQRGAEEIIEAIAPEIYPALTAEIDSWKHREATLGIVSGSPDILIQPLKRRLGFNIATGTRHYISGGRFHESRPVVSRGAEKHKIAHHWTTLLGHNAVLAAAYGDTINDKTLLEQAVHPFAVNPKHDLRQIATENNWNIIITTEKGDEHS